MASASTSKDYKLAIKIAGQVSSSFNSAIGEVGQKISNLGSIAQAAAATAAAAWGALKLGEFISGAVDTYQGFEQAMANTSAIAGATGEQYDALRQAALDMGKATSKTAAECADALGYMSLAGWDVNTSIASLEPVLRLSEATGLDLARCSDLVTDSMSALGVETQDLAKYLDVAAMANNKSNQTAEMLMEAYIGVGGTMKNLNVPLEESATALGVLANRGIKGSEAGTALNTVLANLTTGTGQAGKMMEKLGISAFDSSGNFVGLEETIRRVYEATKGMSDEQRNAALAAIGGKEHLDALNALMSGLTTTTADGAIEWQALSEALYDSKDAMSTMAKTVTDTWTGAKARLESAVDDLKINLVSTFAPYATDAINSVAAAIPNITAAIIPAAQGFVEYALPKIQEFGDKAKAVFSAFKEGGFSGGMEALGGSLSELISGAAQTGASILSDIGANLKGSLPNLMDIGLDFVMGISASIRENAGQMVDGAISLAKGLAQGLADSIPTIVQHVPTIISNIAGVINDNAPKLLAAAANIIWTLAKGLVQAIPTIVQNIPQIIGAIVDTLTAFNWLNLGGSILKGIGKGIKGAVSFVKGIGKQVLEAIKGGFASLPQAMVTVGKNILKGLWNGISGTFGWLRSKIGEIVGGIISTVKDFFGIHSPSTVFADIGKNLILGLFEGISGIWETIVGFFTEAVDGILSFFSGLWSNVQGIWSAVSGWFQATVIAPLISFFSPIVDGISSHFTTAWEVIKAVWNTAAAYFQAVFDTIAGIFSVVAAVLSGDFSGAWEAIKGIVGTWAAFFGTVWEGIKAVFGAAVGWFGGVFSAAWEAIKAVFAPVGAFFQSLWDTIVALFTSIGTAVGDAISGAVKGAINAVLKGAIGIINGFISAINLAIGVINAIPGVKIESIQKLEVPQLAKGGIVTAPTLLEAGEAGNEAIIPLGELWGNMQDMIAANMSGATDGIAALANRLDAADIGASNPSIADLLGQLNNPDDGDGPDGNGGPPVQIIYSPTNHYHFEGDAPKKEDIAGAESMSQEEFNRRMDEYFKQQQRTKFRG